MKPRWGRKEIRWRTDGLAFLTDSLRIEEEDMPRISFERYEEVYTNIRDRRTREYLEGLRRMLV